jgi:DnaJ family protein B protein 4
MGGMGGMGGMSGMGGMGGQGMHSAFQQQGMQPDSAGGFAQARRAPSSKPPLVTRELSLSLEELCTGCTKRLKVTRTRGAEQQSKVLEIHVKPGWKAGTKITYEHEGDDSGPNTPAGDIQFVIKEKAHRAAKREGDNLVFTMRSTLKDVLRGQPVELQHPDGSVLRASLGDLQLQPDGRHAIRFPGRGMPISSAKRAGAKQAGDALLMVHFSIPKRLSEQQRETICAVLDGRV